MDSGYLVKYSSVCGLVSQSLIPHDDAKSSAVSRANKRPPSPAMSENYVVFIEQPIKLDLLKFMLYKIQGKSFHRIMSWQPDYGTVFHLVNRHTGQVGRPLPGS